MVARAPPDCDPVPASDGGQKPSRLSSMCVGVTCHLLPPGWKFPCHLGSGGFCPPAFAGANRHISPISCCGRRSARASGPYSLEPLRRSVGYAFSVSRCVRPTITASRPPRYENRCDMAAKGLRGNDGNRRLERAYSLDVPFTTAGTGSLALAGSRARCALAGEGAGAWLIQAWPSGHAPRSGRPAC